MKHLNVWASEESLVMAAFFFWNSGTDLQMSQGGLLRSLLFQVLRECRPLIKSILPERWEVYDLFSHDDSPWTREELRRAFKRLAKAQVPRTKFVFFIDGLDEFGGDHSALVDFLKDIASCSHIKICVSSRPWAVFGDALVHKPSLMLQDLTYPDIKAFIHSTCHGNPGFAELGQREPLYASELLEAIAQKAAGVFLWVHLVVQSLLAGFINADRVSDIQRRLDSLPPGLEDLYEKMLKSLDPFYFEHATQFFKIVRAAEEPLTLLCLSFADEEPEFVQKCKVQGLSDHDKLLRADVIKRRINSCCKGLLEAGSGSVPYQDKAYSTGTSHLLSRPMGNGGRAASSFSPYITVQYLHRTVKDFLESPKVWAKITGATQNDFNPNLALCKSFVTQVKTLPSETVSQDDFKMMVKWCLRYAYLVEEGSRGGEGIGDLIILLDELDRTATELVNTLDENQSTLMQKWIQPWDAPDSLASMKSFRENWTIVYEYFQPQDSGRTIGQTFFSIAVNLDLRLYVNAKVKKSCLVIEGTGIWPLLADATISHDYFEERFDWCPFPSVHMIKWLLEHGADPNWRLSWDKTVWTRLLENIESRVYDSSPRSWNPRPLKLSLWFGILSLFLQHGADTTVDLNSILTLAMKPIYADQEEVKKILKMAQKPRTKRLFRAFSVKSPTPSRFVKKMMRKSYEDIRTVLPMFSHAPGVFYKKGNPYYHKIHSSRSLHPIFPSSR